MSRTSMQYVQTLATPKHYLDSTLLRPSGHLGSAAGIPRRLHILASAPELGECRVSRIQGQFHRLAQDSFTSMEMETEDGMDRSRARFDDYAASTLTRTRVRASSSWQMAVGLIMVLLLLGGVLVPRQTRGGSQEVHACHLNPRVM